MLKLSHENKIIDLPDLNGFQIGDEVIVDANADYDRFEGVIIGIELRRLHGSSYLVPASRSYTTVALRTSSSRSTAASSIPNRPRRMCGCPANRRNSPMFSKLNLIAGAIAGLAVGVTLYYIANAFIILPAELEKGREIERTATLKKAIELIQERSKTNVEISNLSASALCVELGGVFADGECN